MRIFFLKLRYRGIFYLAKIKKVLQLFYKKYLEEIVFFFLFFLHRYSPNQFNPSLVKKNFRVLCELGMRDRLGSTKDGELYLLKGEEEKDKDRVKNFWTFGTLNSRVHRAVFYTFLTLTLEIYNPFDRKILRTFLYRKLTLIDRLLNKTETINGKPWKEKKGLKVHIEIFHRSSLLQFKVIQNMQKAYRRQKRKDILIDAQKAMDKGLYPLLITQGCSGAYWIRGTQREVLGLFKPFDEEIHAPNNPIGPEMQGAMGQRKTRRGCRIGESAHREVAAFLVDSYFGFGIVPRTYYAQFVHTAFFLSHENRYASRRIVKTKIGSFQEFLSGFVPFDSLEKKEKQEIPLEEFQLLVVLDLIIGNTDRNTGNILIGDEKIAAVDHGLCFPDAIDRYSTWFWAYLDQGKTPLYPSFIDLLRNFPYEDLGLKLKKNCFLSNQVMDRMRERILLCLAGVDRGLPPENLANLLDFKYLFPLRGEHDLKSIAKHQVDLFIEAGMPEKS